MTGIGWCRESSVTNLHVSGASKMVVCSLPGVKTTSGPTSTTEQHFSVRALLTSNEEGPRKGGLKKAHPVATYQFTAAG